MIGLRNASLVVDHPATLVTLGDVSSPEAITALVGLAVTIPLAARRLPGALLIGISAATICASTIGALLGTSTVTTYIESATGIDEGGRTGLTAVVVALLFFLAAVFTPILTMVPVPATAAAILVVGAMMLKGAQDLPWSRPEELIPAFLAIVAMPFTYSIANGVALGIVSWVVAIGY